MARSHNQFCDDGKVASVQDAKLIYNNNMNDNYVQNEQGLIESLRHNDNMDDDEIYDQILTDLGATEESLSEDVVQFMKNYKTRKVQQTTNFNEPERDSSLEQIFNYIRNQLLLINLKESNDEIKTKFVPSIINVMKSVPIGKYESLVKSIQLQSSEIINQSLNQKEQFDLIKMMKKLKQQRKKNYMIKSEKMMNPTNDL